LIDLHASADTPDERAAYVFTGTEFGSDGSVRTNKQANKQARYLTL
jgi:hypothetical protein